MICLLFIYTNQVYITWSWIFKFTWIISNFRNISAFREITVSTLPNITIYAFRNITRTYYIFCNAVSLNILIAQVPTLISSIELHLTGSVRSSSAFSNQELKAEALLANVRYRSSICLYWACSLRSAALRSSESVSNCCHLIIQIWLDQCMCRSKNIESIKSYRNPIHYTRSWSNIVRQLGKMRGWQQCGYSQRLDKKIRSKWWPQPSLYAIHHAMKHQPPGWIESNG